MPSSAPARFFGLVPAAGGGVRFGGTGVKQYAPINGAPMLRHAVASLLAAGEIEAVFVVLAPGDASFRNIDWSGCGGRVEPLYCGGATRRDSVLNGLVGAAPAVEPDDWILVHDAARPCLARAELRRLIDTVKEEGGGAGGLLAVRVADTLKRGGDADRVAATVPRDTLWQAQTPQMFRYGVLLGALRAAPDVTDEAAAVENAGLRPRLVEGSARNLKVTYPADLELAALILRSAGR
jgi:2-C-methyl-D-erythritol 4-phosphate cytidylyltransferase